MQLASDSARDRFWTAAVIAITSTIGFWPAAHGQFCQEQQKFSGSNSTSSDQFGNAVACSGSTAAVGSRWAGQSNGAAYIFTCTGGIWTEQSQLTPSDTAANDVFGWSIALSDDVALVGAPGNDHAAGNGAGAAFIFTRKGTTWTQQAKLTASNGAPGDGFGAAVALSGDTAVITATGADHAGETNAGSAYVFIHKDGSWAEQATLTAPNAAADDQFGHSVALSGNTVVICAWLDDNAGGVNAGAAYVFTRNDSIWSQQAMLTASDALAHDALGFSVAVLADTTVVGARNDDHSGWLEAGSAYVFTRTGSEWTQEAKLIASDPNGDVAFGTSIALASNVVAIGGSPGPEPGSVYVFVPKDGLWTEQVKLTAFDSFPYQHFGFSTAVSGDTILVGALQATDGSGEETGAVYAFECSALSTCPADIAPVFPTGDGNVNVGDLSIVLSTWGPCGESPACAGDIYPPETSGNGTVNVDDLLMVINAWGACP